ncbi:hypothetical protein, partial [Actinotalea ferrariae]|uniref:hypothetical protein n=1 Tax=Actinotalea ferrariae TaxID=1386098 RepID=UPI001C8C5189
QGPSRGAHEPVAGTAAPALAVAVASSPTMPQSGRVLVVVPRREGDARPAVAVATQGGAHRRWAVRPATDVVRR